MQEDINLIKDTYYARVYDNKFVTFLGGIDNYEPNKSVLGIYSNSDLPSNSQILHFKVRRKIPRLRVLVTRTIPNVTPTYRYLTSIGVYCSPGKLEGILKNPKQLTFPNCVVSDAYHAIKK